MIIYIRHIHMGYVGLEFMDLWGGRNLRQGSWKAICDALLGLGIRHVQGDLGYVRQSTE